MISRELFNLKELLALASYQLSDHVEKHEDISFSRDNIEAALEIIMKETISNQPQK